MLILGWYNNSSCRSLCQTTSRSCLKKGLIPFRYENMWLKNKSFNDLKRDWWWSLRFQGTSSFVVAKKLKALKLNLKRWNREVFGNVEVQKMQALKKI